MSQFVSAGIISSGSATAAVGCISTRNLIIHAIFYSRGIRMRLIKDLISGPVDRGLSSTTQVVGARELNSYSTLCEQIQVFREDLTKRQEIKLRGFLLILLYSIILIFLF